MKTTLLFCFFLLVLLPACSGDGERRVLVLTKTEAFRHGSIAAGLEALRAIGAEDGFIVDTTESGAAFTEANLQRYDAVVFLNTSGDVLTHAQQADFERYIQAGGGFVGIHAAADTERDWPWYGGLVGAYLDVPVDDPARVRPHRLVVLDDRHPATEGLPEAWERTDEAYHLSPLPEGTNVLVAVRDEAGAPDVPFSWYREYDGGRMFYTAGGHTPASFAEPAFRRHLAGGLRYAMGGEALDYRRARSPRLPDEDRFVQVVLEQTLDEPTELAVLDDGRVLYVERKGRIRRYDPATGSIETIARLDVHTGFEDGLLGIASDPNFAQNHWIYLYYAVPGSEPKNRLSRFELRGDSLLTDSERVMLEVPTQRETCCHTGGSLAFGPDGLLYLSTGDNTNPFASSGFAPIDGRPGRAPFDARSSASNTNDLRGKILRIRPEPDGTYTIPAGNLFEDDDPLTRPEIFVMGNRNPYRISVDQKTGYLYWGEVGPDAGEDNPLRGPRGYDEINQARQAGYYGWPLFIADNKPYRRYDFASGVSGPAFDPAAPVNDSPHNTGIAALPPAQPAFLWYPYAVSPEFPIFGSGGRTAMAGPVFYRDAYEVGANTFPAYYDGKLFIYEWMRGWIMVVTMDEEGNLLRIEPFMGSTRFHNPSDMAFDRHGTMYLLEYGTAWFSRNPDARFSRIVYEPGNRRPVARIAADRTLGAAPLAVHLTSEGTRDADGDALTYAWRMDTGGEVQSQQTHVTFTYTEPGVYHPTLTVTDAAGDTATATLEIRVGNAPPEVNLTLTGNRTFYWDDTVFDYAASAHDDEDGPVAEEAIDVRIDYRPSGLDQAAVQPGHQAAPEISPFAEGLRLIEGSDCAACHQPDAPSIGPSYVAVAERYDADDRTVDYLATKIIRGGGGVWGEQAMAAHPQLSRDEAEEMVRYILFLSGEVQREPGLPARGTYATRAHLATRTGEPGRGHYVLRASYTDRGASAAGAVTSQDVVVLRHARVEAETFDRAGGADVLTAEPPEPSYVRNLFDGSYLVFEDIDLTGVQGLTYGVRMVPLNDRGGTIELHLGAPDGPLVSSVNVPGGGSRTFEVEAPIQPTRDVHDLYFVFKNPADTSGEPLFLLDWIQFRNR